MAHGHLLCPQALQAFVVDLDARDAARCPGRCYSCGAAGAWQTAGYWAAAGIFPCVEVAFFSYDGGDAAGFLRRMRERGPAVCVATLGADGSMAYNGRQFYRQGIVPCQVVDTMGAGDSFIAGFLHSRLAGADIPACMAAGAQSSAVTLAYKGAW